MCGQLGGQQADAAWMWVRVARMRGCRHPPPLLPGVTSALQGISLDCTHAPLTRTHALGGHQRAAFPPSRHAPAPAAYRPICAQPPAPRHGARSPCPMRHALRPAAASEHPSPCPPTPPALGFPFCRQQPGDWNGRRFGEDRVRPVRSGGAYRHYLAVFDQPPCDRLEAGRHRPVVADLVRRAGVAGAGWTRRIRLAGQGVREGAELRQ